MSSLPVVLTIEAAAERLLTTPEKVQAELEAGRLEGFRLGEEWRITEPALLKFMGISPPDTSTRTPPMSSAATVTAPQSLDFDAILADVEWKPVEPLVYNWPDEHPPVTYDEVYEGQVTIGGNPLTLRIAFCTADSLGDKSRRRGVVFMGHPPSLNPLVEFSGENSPAFAVSGRLASIVKLRTGKHLRPGQPVPAEYQGFPLDVYNKLVVGPYAAASMAVVVHRTDFRLMAHHALIRAHWKGLI
jgi:excisionase family DNA binding protein